jgi:predicted O-methyltransferase YrrM
MEECVGYQGKLLHHYDELNTRQRIRYHLADRFRFSAEDRFFFEGCRGNPGQMFLAERRALYEAILRHQPRHCFEIGTYTGGGSTFFLAHAFARLGKGKVITMESDASLHKRCVNFYHKRLPKLFPFVEFVHGDRVEALSPYIGDRLDCFFLDGAEDADQTVSQYLFFEQFCDQGTVMMAHDWHTEKMKNLRAMLPEAAMEWRLEVRLDSPVSVGFVVMVCEGRKQG